MTATQVRQVLRADAVFDFGAAVLLGLGTWDGLWQDALDLPQGQPALFVQVGGAALAAFAYLLWRAADDAALRAPVAIAGAIGNGLAAATVVAWLVSGKLPDNVDTLGHVLLIGLAVVLAAFALLEAQAARSSGAEGQPPGPLPEADLH
jgi:drug/metabolite transporter superfamily protein YnfA